MCAARRTARPSSPKTQSRRNRWCFELLLIGQVLKFGSVHTRRQHFYTYLILRVLVLVIFKFPTLKFLLQPLQRLLPRYATNCESIVPCLMHKKARNCFFCWTNYEAVANHRPTMRAAQNLFYCTPIDEAKGHAGLVHRIDPPATDSLACFQILSDVRTQDNCTDCPSGLPCLLQPY